MATSRSRKGSLARYTTPIPPRPMTSTMSYFPILVVLLGVAIAQLSACRRKTLVNIEPADGPAFSWWSIAQHDSANAQKTQGASLSADPDCVVIVLRKENAGKRH